MQKQNRSLGQTLRSIYDSCFRVFAWITQKPWLNIIAGFMLAVLFYGISRYPENGFFSIAQNPFLDYEGANWNSESILLPLLTYYSGLRNSLQGYLLFCLLILILAFVLLTWLAKKKYGIQAAAFTPWMLALNPALLAAFIWMGSVDGITVLLSGLLLFSTSPIFSFAIALLGTTNHTQMLVIAASVAFLGLFAAEGRNGKVKALLNGAAMVTGGIAGYGLIYLFLAKNNITLHPSRLEFILTTRLGFWWNVHSTELPASLFAYYGIFWFILAFCLLYGFQRKPLYYSAFLFTQLIAFIFAYLTLDTTRVFSLLTLPTVFHCIYNTFKLVETDVENRENFQKLIFLSTLIGILLPKYSAWEGQLFSPPVTQFWVNQLTKILNLFR